MSTQAATKTKKASFFRMRAQMLEAGRTNTRLARTDNMWATPKENKKVPAVYREGEFFE